MSQSLLVSNMCVVFEKYSIQKKHPLEIFDENKSRHFNERKFKALFS